MATASLSQGLRPRVRLLPTDVNLSPAVLRPVGRMTDHAEGGQIYRVFLDRTANLWTFDDEGVELAEILDHSCVRFDDAWARGLYRRQYRACAEDLTILEASKWAACMACGHVGPRGPSCENCGGAL